ncbi:MAG: PAS domain-containing protein [Acutalibacteraceae bacterium]
MDAKLLELLEQIAKAIAAQFGSNCEVVLHELSGKSAYSSIVAIENGHVTGRKVGDGPSHVVLEQLGHEDDNAEDQLGYLTRTKDGKILKSSSVYIRDETGKVTGILGINYDISMMQLFENSCTTSFLPTSKPAASRSASRSTWPICWTISSGRRTSLSASPSRS